MSIENETVKILSDYTHYIYIYIITQLTGVHEKCNKILIDIEYSLFH